MSACRHNKRGAEIVTSMDVEFFDGDVSTHRLVPIRLCPCGAWLRLGEASDKDVAADIIAARRIQSIEQMIDELGPKARPPPVTLVRVLARNAKLTTGEMYGWGARDTYHGTDPWDAGWLTAAYFDYDPCDMPIGAAWWNP